MDQTSDSLKNSSVINDPVSNWLEDFNQRFSKHLLSQNKTISSIINYLNDSGGKRYRPKLSFLISKALGHSRLCDQLYTVTAFCELVHLATLLHDDIIDQSPARRGKPSPLAVYGPDMTLLAGDLLLVKAFGICSELPHEICIEAEQTCLDLIEGESLETEISIFDASPEDSLCIARKKTAALFRFAASAAGQTVQADHDDVCHLRSFAEQLGVGFQIIDDILDVKGSEAIFGKKRGVDIIEGKPSLVNTLWLQSDSECAKEIFKASTKERPGLLPAAIAELENSSILKEAEDIAKDRISSAMSSLDSITGFLPDSEAVQALKSLRQLTEKTLSRIC